MNYEQRKRWDKLTTDSFYLLGISTVDDKIKIDISGSTANVYTVTYYLDDAGFFCTCPDARSHAKRHNVVCKHVCFVLNRLLKFKVDFLLKEFFDTIFFEHNSEVHNMVVTKLQNIENNLFGETSADVVNRKYIDAFQKQKEKQHTHASDGVASSSAEPKVDVEPEKKSLFDAVKTVEDDAECMICFDIMTNDVKLVECPTCHNLTHQDCMENWLKSKTTCIYCRSEWKNYFKEKACNGNKKNKKKLIQDDGYLNLANLV